jgi:uncharacterized protein (TIGR02147 family)
MDKTQLPKEAIDVFSYQDFRIFLRDFYRERRLKDRKFSIRFFARRAGLRSQNYLKVVMDGRRSLTPRNMPKFVKGLGLDTSQAEYFEALVNLNQARDVVERRQYLDRVLHLQKKKAALTLSGEQLEFFTSWHHIVIFEMACQDNFKAIPEWISQRLKGKITPKQAADSLAIMIGTGILKHADYGKLTPVAAQIASSEDVPQEQLRKLHDSFIEQATQALHMEGPETRDIKSLTIGLTPDQAPVFRKKVEEFQRELNTLFSTGKGTDVYQFNMQFFKLTKSDNEV